MFSVFPSRIGFVRYGNRLAPDAGQNPNTIFLPGRVSIMTCLSCWGTTRRRSSRRARSGLSIGAGWPGWAAS